MLGHSGHGHVEQRHFFRLAACSSRLAKRPPLEGIGRFRTGRSRNLPYGPRCRLLLVSFQKIFGIQKIWLQQFLFAISVNPDLTCRVTAFGERRIESMQKVGKTVMRLSSQWGVPTQIWESSRFHDSDFVQFSVFAFSVFAVFIVTFLMFHWCRCWFRFLRMWA